MKIFTMNEKPIKTAFYVEYDLEFGQFDWDIVETEEKAKQYIFYKLANLNDLCKLQREKKQVFEEVLIREGLAKFDFNKNEYKVKKLSKFARKMFYPTT